MFSRMVYCVGHISCPSTACMLLDCLWACHTVTSPVSLLTGAVCLHMLLEVLNLLSTELGQHTIALHDVEYEAQDEDVDPAFSFAGQRLRSTSVAEVQEHIDDACQMMPQTSPLRRALQRGIGVHHAGLHKKFRQGVEMLFRCGHVRIVFATGSASSTGILHAEV